MDNFMKIKQHNKKYKQGEISYLMGINQFSDKLFSEYLEEISCNQINNNDDFFENNTLYISETINTPNEFDWTKKGAVTAIKNQGSCGSCYAFAAIGALESAHWKRTGKLISLSEQQILDCSGKFGNFGCKGGWSSKSYKYIKYNHGVDTEKSYPYIGQHRRCHFNTKTIGAKINGYIRLPYGNENNMKSFISTNGPVAVSIDAHHPSFQHYHTGVYYEPHCTKQTTHAVVVVGYGTVNGIDYWKVKNSWGKSWGNNGYILMSRNRKNNCAIASHAVYPIAA